MKYLQVTVSTTHEFSSLAALVLMDEGSEGVNIVDDEEMQRILKETHWDYVDEKLLAKPSPIVLVSGFFEQDFDVEKINSQLQEMKERTEFETGPLEIICKIIDSADYENVWKKYYVPIKIGKIAIVPNWLKNTFEDAVPVYINPGMAFGTGNHETTSMCIELMQRNLLSGKTVADVGCGSGILGICALKLGAKKCTFIDTDYNAIRASEENLKFNDALENAEIIHASLFDKTAEIFDVVLANLTADILIMLYKSLSTHLKKGGEIIISGIIKERLKQVEDVFLKDFEKCELITQGEWCALYLKKK